MASGEIGVNRSSSRSASLWKLPARSNQFLPLNSVDVDHQRVALPAADRVPHVGPVGRQLHVVQVDGARRAGELERHLDLVRALHDLERIGHVHRPRDPRQVALELGVAIDPVGGVLLLDGERFRRVRNPAVPLHDAERAGHPAGRAQVHPGRKNCEMAMSWPPRDVAHPGDDERQREDRARERRGVEDVDEAAAPLPADQLGGEADHSEEELEVETGRTGHRHRDDGGHRRRSGGRN